MARRYGVTDLGALGKSDMSVSAINTHGQVVGSPRDRNGMTRAVFFDGVTLHDLGALTGSGTSSAADINDAGLVVGQLMTESDEGHAVVWDQGILHDLGTLGGGDGYATAVNNRGQIVGASRLSVAQSRPKSEDERYFVKEEDTHAFLYEGGKMHDLGTTGGDYSEASNISDAGIIVGSVITANNSIRALIIDPRDGAVARILDPLPGGGYSDALDINAAGLIVGSSTHSNGNLAPIEFRDGVAAALPYPPGLGITKALAVNIHGEIVGYSEPMGKHKRALYWHGGEMVDLNEIIRLDPGWILTEATDINDAGQIVVNAEKLDRHGAFLLTPLSPDAIG